MRRQRCVCCGLSIHKSARHDPHLCRECEFEMEYDASIDGYSYLDT